MAEIANIDELRVWALNEHINVASARVRVRNGAVPLTRLDAIRQRLDAVCAARHVSQSTFQFESAAGLGGWHSADRPDQPEL